MPDGEFERVVATYDYESEDGELLYQVLRYEPKTFRQRQPDGRGGWTWRGYPAAETVPYRLPAFAGASGATVYVVEGEKDADALRALGLVATCNAGGAGKWPEHFANYFCDCSVVILPDNDLAGLAHADLVARNLAPVATSVRIVELPGLPVKGDVADWLAAGGTPRELFKLAAATPKYEPPVTDGGDDEPAGNAAPALEPVNPASLAGVPVPPRRWLVPDWLPLARVTALYGAGGEGKTILAQMLATACAIGALWLGLPVLRCNSLLLFCEDDLAEMHRRQEDINQHFGCTWGDLGAMRWLPRLGNDNALMSFEGRPHRTPLFDQLLNAAKEHDAKLVATDTLADVFAGNENDRGQARAFAQSALGLIARETEGSVLCLAHPSRSGMNSGSGESGSTAWIGTFRSQAYLSTPKGDGPEDEPPDPNARMLTRKKSNAARRDETIELRWHQGVFVAKQAPTGIIGSIERRVAERVFLDLLDRMNSEGRYVSESNRAANYAPRLFASRPDREGYREPDFKRAMEALFARKEIVVGTFKNANRNVRERIVRLGASGASGSD